MIKDGVVLGKSESLTRWLILFLTCLMMIGNYYCYDIPAALHSQMDDYFGKTDDFETLFSLLYTVYSVPNVILPFFGGYFTDKFGPRVCLIVFAGFITLGQFIFAMGLSMKSWPVMLLGRVVFGFGGESMGVANSAILSYWFKGKELAFAFGLNLSLSRLGSVFNNLISPVLADSIDIQFALWFGVILCGGSVISALLIAFIDREFDEHLLNNKGAHLVLSDNDDVDAGDEDTRERKEAQKSLNKPLLTNEEETEHRFSTAAAEEAAESVRRDSFVGSADAVEKVAPQFKDVLQFKPVFWIITLICVIVYGCVLPFNNIASTLLLERDYFKEPPDGCRLTNTSACQNDVTNPPYNCPSDKYYQPPIPENIVLDGVGYYPLTTSDIDCTDDFWSDGCLKEYCDRESDAEIEAGTIMSIPYIISACLSPILGGFVDRYGLRAVISTLAPVILVIVHSFLGYSDCSPVGPLVGQGLAYSGFAAVIWPSVPLVVPARLLGFAYGVAFSIQNAGLASFPLIVAAIYTDNNDHYIPTVELFFVIVAVLGVIVGIFLNFYDFFYIDSILNKPDMSKVAGEVSRNNSTSSLVNPVLGSAVIVDDDEDADAKQHSFNVTASRTFHKSVDRHGMEHEVPDDGTGGDRLVRVTSSELFSSLH